MLDPYQPLRALFDMLRLVSECANGIPARTEAASTEAGAFFEVGRAVFGIEEHPRAAGRATARRQWIRDFLFTGSRPREPWPSVDDWKPVRAWIEDELGARWYRAGVFFTMLWTAQHGVDDEAAEVERGREARQAVFDRESRDRVERKWGPWIRALAKRLPDEALQEFRMVRLPGESYRVDGLPGATYFFTVGDVLHNEHGRTRIHPGKIGQPTRHSGIREMLMGFFTNPRESGGPGLSEAHAARLTTEIFEVYLGEKTGQDAVRTAHRRTRASRPH